MKPFSIIAVTASIFLVACGGGGSSTVAGIDRGGSPMRVGIVSKGSINGFGSVIVNGVRFDTSGASFDIDGSAGNESDLRVGQVVVVQGTIAEDGSDARALTVGFDDVVEGPISTIDVATATITVLGQTVVIGADTSFDDNISPASIDGLAVDDIVEVSGFFLADGRISASRIEAKPAGGEFEVTGIVSNLGATTFAINGLTVDFSAAQLDDFPTGTPEVGQLVEAKGTSIGAGGQLLATRVEFKVGDLPAIDGDFGEIEGFITRFASAADFDVEGVPVTTDGSTIFENGTAADLALNRKVEVEGSFNSAGVLVANKVELKLATFIRIEGLVDAVAGDQLTIFNIAIATDSLTRFEDKSSQDVQNFNIADIQVGDYVETRGFENSDGIVATRVEREDFDNEVAIRAFVDSLSEPNFTIRGVTIQTGGGTVFRDTNDQPITANEFFGQANGRLVEASGSPNGNTIIVASEVELEN